MPLDLSKTAKVIVDVSKNLSELVKDNSIWCLVRVSQTLAFNYTDTTISLCLHFVM